MCNDGLCATAVKRNKFRTALILLLVCSFDADAMVLITLSYTGWSVDKCVVYSVIFFFLVLIFSLSPFICFFMLMFCSLASLSKGFLIIDLFQDQMSPEHSNALDRSGFGSF